jgi:hypothetical protein
MLTTGLFGNHRVNSAPAGSHSILALSNDRQPTKLAVAKPPLKSTNGKKAEITFIVYILIS